MSIEDNMKTALRHLGINNITTYKKVFIEAQLYNIGAYSEQQIDTFLNLYFNN